MTLRRLLPLLLVLPLAAACGSTHRATPPPPPPTVPNSPDCRPPKQHPDPVVLVHGTFADTSWDVIAPALARRGYCVFTFNYGDQGTAEISLSARQLASFVDRLLALTHAKKVSIVGHSEGGMMPRYYIRFLGGASKVDDLIGLSPSNHGTENPLALAGYVLGCVACGEQLTFGSTFLARLNAGVEAPGPVDYTVVQTSFDLVVVPYTSAFLHGPANHITNVVLQQDCADDAVAHQDIPTDPVAAQWVENALSRPGPADPQFHPRCG